MVHDRFLAQPPYSALGTIPALALSMVHEFDIWSSDGPPRGSPEPDGVPREGLFGGLPHLIADSDSASKTDLDPTLIFLLGSISNSPASPPGDPRGIPFLLVQTVNP
jgi:hypothetical protein